MTASVLPSDSEIPGLVLGPRSVAWRRASDPRLYLGAGYALLLQIAHPTVGAGVRDFSTFEKDPWDRLLRTIDYVNLSVYGGREAAAVGRRLRELHKPIRGTNPDGTRYHALEPEAYAWVHGTLAESIVAGQAYLGRPLPPDETERFYREWLGVGRFVGVREGDLPPDWSGFRAYFDRTVAERLERTETVDRFLRAIEEIPRPAVPMLPRALWHLLRKLPARALWIGAVGPLPPVLRERFGITWTSTNDVEFRAQAALLRALTPLMPRRLRISGPDYLRWRRCEIARGPLGPSAGADLRNSVTAAHESANH